MTLQIATLERVRFYQEAAGAFGTVQSITAANHTDIPVVEGSISLEVKREMLARGTTQTRVDQIPTDVTGLLSWSLSFDTLLASTGTTASNGVAQIQGPVGKMLEVAMGGQSLGTGDLATGTPTTTAIDIELGSAATHNFVAGAAIGIGAAGSTEMREIKSVASAGVDTLTLKIATSSAPSAGATLFGTASYYLLQDPTKSAQFVVEGYEKNDMWMLAGGQLESLGIETPIGQLPKLKWKWSGTYWATNTRSADGMSSVTAGSITPVHVFGELMCQAASGSVRNRIEASSIEISPKISYVPIKSPSGANDNVVFRFRRNRVNPVCEGSFVTSQWAIDASGSALDDLDYTWHTAQAGLTAYRMSWQIGDTPGAILLLSCPYIQVTNVQREKADGIFGYKVSYKAMEDADSLTTEIGRSPLRIHLG